MEKKVLEVSWGSLWRILFFLIFVIIMFLGRGILLGLFLAIIISSGLEVLVNIMEKRGIPRTLGVIIIFVLSALTLTIVLYTVIPFVIIDLNGTISEFSSSSHGSWLGPFFNLKVDSLSALVNKVAEKFFVGDISPIEIFGRVLGGLGLAVAVIISSFYLSLTRDGVERFILAVFPVDIEEYALRVYEKSRKKISAWFRTQIFLSLIMGFLVWLSLFILGVKHAFLLGIMAGIFELAPFVGPILAGAASVVSASTTSFPLAMYTLIVFLLLHQIESHFLVPIFTKRSVGLHPVIVIISLLIGLEVAGFLGLLIAVPTAAVFQEIIEDWTGRKKPKEA